VFLPLYEFIVETRLLFHRHIQDLEQTLNVFEKALGLAWPWIQQDAQLLRLDPFVLWGKEKL
jgi:hypothetical protein